MAQVTFAKIQTLMSVVGASFTYSNPATNVAMDTTHVYLLGVFAVKVRVELLLVLATVVVEMFLMTSMETSLVYVELCTISELFICLLSENVLNLMILLFVFVEVLRFYNAVVKFSLLNDNL